MYKARIEGLEMVLQEKDKIIEHLENDLTKAGQREEDLKQMHNNYFLQIQTLINQKAIGSPVQEKSQPAQKERNLSSMDGSKSSMESSISAQEKKTP